MSFLNLLQAHKPVEHREADGLELAVSTVERFQARSFRFKGVGMKASGVPGKEVIRFIREELPDYYTYMTQVKTYSDRRKRSQARIEITGTMGVSRELNRYNPFDVKCSIRTEKATGD